MVLEYQIDVGQASDDAACGMVRAAANRDSMVYDRLRPAQPLFQDNSPQPLGVLSRFVAVSSGETVGFADYEPASGYVKMLFVTPKHQGQGIASALLDLCGRACAVPLKLKTQSVNDGALAFYLKQGFRITGGYGEDDWHGTPVVWIELEREPAR